MTRIPRHWLELAAAADRRSAGWTPDTATRIAALIWAALPPEPRDVILARQLLLLEAVYGPRAVPQMVGRRRHTAHHPTGATA